MRRISQHKEGLIEGFTKKYHVKKLVYVEEFSSPEEAIACEKRLKKWKREWKIRLITELNPNWKDLYNDEF
jgi:putative endonuclease